MKKRKIAVLLALTLTAASVIGGCNKEEETENCYLTFLHIYRSEEHI